MSVHTGINPGRVRRALTYTLKAAATVVALAYSIALCGTVLGTVVGILINEAWAR